MFVQCISYTDVQLWCNVTVQRNRAMRCQKVYQQHLEARSGMESTASLVFWVNIPVSFSYKKAESFRSVKGAPCIDMVLLHLVYLLDNSDTEKVLFSQQKRQSLISAHKRAYLISVVFIKNQHVWSNTLIYLPFQTKTQPKICK